MRPRMRRLPRPVWKYHGWDPARRPDILAREIRALDVFHEFRNRDRRLVNLCADSIDDLSQVVWRNVGRHANSDAGATIDQ